MESASGVVVRAGAGAEELMEMHGNCNRRELEEGSARDQIPAD